MLNELAVLPLYLACQSLMPQNFSDNGSVFETLPKFPKLALELPQGYTVFPDVGMAYKVYKNNIKWAQAQKYCAGEGANLAVVDSFKKVEYIMALKGPTNHIHVGMHRLFDDIEWVQVKDGLPPARIAWRLDSYESYNVRKCTAILSDGSGVLATECGAAYYFVCEIPISK